MQHVGIDVHKVSSQLCFIDENGNIIEKRIPTERKRFQNSGNSGVGSGTTFEIILPCRPDSLGE